MLNEIEDRKKTYRFMKSYYRELLKYDEYALKVIIDFGATNQQFKNIVDNKTEHLTREKALNLKQIFTKILERSLKTIVLISVEKHDIKTEDFLELSKKMGIDNSLISKAEQAHNNYKYSDKYYKDLLCGFWVSFI